MALIAGDERVRQANADSVKVALSELETFAACRGNEILGRLKRHDLTGELCAAIFEHDARRSLDPQLHAHCVVAKPHGTRAGIGGLRSPSLKWCTRFTMSERSIRRTLLPGKKL